MNSNAISSDTLALLQALPLNLKERRTEQRIIEFFDYYGIDNVYYSFSGGKDSTVLKHIIMRLFPNSLGMFVDTPMEYPQVRAFVKAQGDGIIRLRPEGSIKEIIDDCGWVFPSKDVAQIIEAARRDQKWAIDRLNGLDKYGNPSPFRERYRKWWPLVDAPFKVSDRCCHRMKGSVVARFERETGRHPILALLADESARRKEAYMRTGCNSFESNRPMCKPMGFWTQNDVLQYIYEHNLEIAAPYGDVVMVSQPSNANVSGFGSCQGCRFKTTGEPRTGCMFCTIGCHLDNFAKIKRLRVYNPRLYEYCMDYLGEREVLSWIDAHYCKR